MTGTGHTPTDTQAPTISNVRITEKTKNGYRVTCNISDNIKVTRVEFHTWNLAVGAPDIKMQVGTISGNTATCYVPMSDHNNKMGTYLTHIYAYDNSGNRGFKSTEKVDLENVNPEVGKILVSYVSSKGYRVSCEVSDNVGVTEVKFPSWQEDNKDVKWHVGALNNDKNVATCYIPLSEHNNAKGSYMTHIDPYDSCQNNISRSIKAVTITDEPIEMGSVEYNGNTYKVYNSGKSWKEAKEWCEKQGGHLATITSAGEWNTIKNLLSTKFNTYCWLGAENTSGTWKWVTGESFSFSDWDVNQPDGGDEHYLGTHNTNSILKSDKWNDFAVNSDRIGGFVCEFEKPEPTTPPTSATIWPDDIDFDVDNEVMTIGTKQKVHYVITPANATNKNIEWKSSDTSIATVSNDGVITAKSVGSVEIWATYALDELSWISHCIDITVVKPQKTTVSLARYSANIYVKGSTVIKPTVKNGKGKTTYKSSNTKVARVYSNGKVVALKAGTAKITVTNNKVSKVFTVKVLNPRLSRTSVSISRGKSYNLKIVGIIGTAKFYTSNKKVATVNSAGKITVNKKAKKNQSCYITVKTNGVTLRCKVKVK